MFTAIIIAIFLPVSAGSYLILADQLKLTGGKVKKAAKAFHNKDSSSLDAFIDSLAFRLSGHIHMDSYKKKKLEADLKSLNMTLSPELYKATNIVKSGLLLCVAILLLFFLPLAAFGLIALAILLYFISDNDLNSRLQKKKEEIQNELPRFACTINQELKSSRDVLSILVNYKNNAGESLKEELDITVADMRSGNYEAALLRLEGRLSISALSDIVRGLIGVLRGDNNAAYFDMLSHDLDIIEVQRLENMAMKQPGKIKKYLVLLLICTLLMYLTVLGIYVIDMTS